jgi:hypothetical protein
LFLAGAGCADFVQEGAGVPDRESALEICLGVGTSAALLSLAWAAIELTVGVDVLGIVVFAVLTAIAITSVLMIVALQRGWFGTYLGKAPGKDLASSDAERPD